jgi:choline kinase
MENKLTAIEFLLDNIYLLNSLKWKDIITEAKIREQDQTIDFASKVLNKAECSWTGIPYIEESLIDIYEDTYGKAR